MATQLNTTTEIPLSELKGSPTNPRKFFDPAKLKDLSESFKSAGQLQPALVRLWNRPGFKGYEIVAGERRFRAATMAGLPSLRCEIRELDDKTVVEFQILENVQRDDLQPLEEARGYKLLHEEHGYSWEDLATKIGKSQSYIYGRLRLLDLHPKILKLLEEGKLQLSYCTELQRIDSKEEQLKVLDDIQYDGNYGDFENVKELRDHINDNYMLQLAKASFDTKDADLVPGAGACAACPKRTGAQAELFGDAGKKDSCLDSNCWGKKIKAHQEQVTLKMKEKGQDVVQLKPGQRFDGKARGLVLLSEKDYDLKDNVTWKAALEKAKAMDKISPIAVVDTKGKTDLYAHKKEIVAALPKSAWDYDAPSDNYGSGSSGKKTLAGPARVKRLAELAAVRETWPAEWPKVIDKLQEAPLTGETLRVLVNVIVHDIVRYPMDNEVKERTGAKIESQFTAAKSDKELRRLLWNLALGVGLYAGNTKLTRAGEKVFKLSKSDWTGTLQACVDKKLAERKAKIKAKEAGSHKPIKNIVKKTTFSATEIADMKKKGWVKQANGAWGLPKVKMAPEKYEYTNVLGIPADAKKPKPKKKGK